MSIILTEALIKKKSFKTALIEVDRLNLAGLKLEDISILSKVPNLKILTLTYNSVSDLEILKSCTKLQELYLRCNKVSDINQARFLAEIPNLRILWLAQNPISEQENYRKQIINLIPQLYKLDQDLITSNERKGIEEPRVNLESKFENASKDPQGMRRASSKRSIVTKVKLEKRSGSTKVREPLKVRDESKTENEGET